MNNDQNYHDELTAHLSTQVHPKPHPSFNRAVCNSYATQGRRKRETNWGAIIVGAACAGIWAAMAWALMEILK